MTRKTTLITFAGPGGSVLLAVVGATASLRNPGFSELSNGRGGTNFESVAYTPEMGFNKKWSFEAFKATVYPLLRANCSECHSTENRTAVVRMGIERHNCLVKAAASSAKMLAAVIAWRDRAADMIPKIPRTVEPSGAITQQQVMEWIDIWTIEWAQHFYKYPMTRSN